MNTSTSRAHLGTVASKILLILVTVMALLVLTALVLRLVPRSAHNEIYYVTLVGWGLISAGILTLVLRTFAHIRGERFGWTINLRGATAISFLVVAGGYIFLPKAAFNLTVRLRPPDSSIIQSGTISAEFGNNTQTKDVRGGEADFNGVGPEFWGKQVWMRADIVGYSSDPQLVLIDSDAVEFPLHKPSLHTIKGRLNPQPKAVSVVRVCILDPSGRSIVECRQPDGNGVFEFSVNEAPNDEIRVGVCIAGKLAFDELEEFGTGTTIIIKTEITKQACPF
jgi:hypothetical protein